VVLRLEQATKGYCLSNFCALTHMKTKQAQIIQFPKTPEHCIDCGLKKRCLTKVLPEEHKNINKEFNSQRGECLYHAGDSLRSIIILRSGSAKTELIAEDGAVQIIGFHFPGDILGLDSIAKNKALSSVIFLEKSVTCKISMQYIRSKPLLQEEMLARLSLEIARTYDLLLSTNNKTVEQRFAFFLQDLANRQFKRGLSGTVLNLSMSRSDIANYLGLATATVSRIVGKFEREGLIHVSKRQITLLSPSKTSILIAKFKAPLQLA
jgi:CRP/FNR family transcriptional regulator